MPFLRVIFSGKCIIRHMIEKLICRIILSPETKKKMVEIAQVRENVESRQKSRPRKKKQTACPIHMKYERFRLT